MVAEAPQADLNLFGLVDDPDFDFVRRMVRETNSACLFVRDSGRLVLLDDALRILAWCLGQSRRTELAVAGSHGQFIVLCGLFCYQVRGLQLSCSAVHSVWKGPWPGLSIRR